MLLDPRGGDTWDWESTLGDKCLYVDWGTRSQTDASLDVNKCARMARARNRVAVIPN